MKSNFILRWKVRFFPLGLLPLYVVCAFIIMGLTGACTRREMRMQMDTQTSAAPMIMTKSLHPHSIKALQNRLYTAEDLTFIKKIEAKKGLEAWDFSYRSEKNRIYGLIEKPSGLAPSDGWPVIVLAHGHIPPDIYSTWKSYRLVSQYYAAGGFLVVKPDYRGHHRSEGSTEGPTRGVEYSIDVLNLIAGIKEIPDANPHAVFFYGHSMGGEIGLRVLEVSKAILGATIWAGVTQEFPENRLYYSRRHGGNEATELKKLIESSVTPQYYASISPLNYLEEIRIPLLVHHGDADQSVPFEWSITFREALDEAKVEYRFYAYAGEDHNISKSFYRVMDSDMEFFRSLLSS